MFLSTVANVVRASSSRLYCVTFSLSGTALVVRVLCFCVSLFFMEEAPERQEGDRL